MNDTPYWNDLERELGPLVGIAAVLGALVASIATLAPLSSPDAVVEREACPACIVRASLSPPRFLDAAQARVETACGGANP